MAKDADADKRYRRLIERMRQAVLMARGLGPAERQVALLMLERSNRARFVETGWLWNWLSETTLARCSGLSERAVRKARASLRARGVVHNAQPGGQKRGDTAVYTFQSDWLVATEKALEADGTKQLWDGVRGNAGSPISQSESQERGNSRSPINEPEPEVRGNNRAVKGEQAFRGWGNGRSPEPLESNPLSEPLDSRARALPKQEERSGQDITLDRLQRTFPDRPREDLHKIINHRLRFAVKLSVPTLGDDALLALFQEAETSYREGHGLTDGA